MGASMSEVSLSPERIIIRHIRKGTAAETGAVLVANSYFVPQPWEAVNGENGWQSGSYERRVSDDGRFTIVFPNAVGTDSVRHLERFLYFSDEDYKPGDEWLEFWPESPGYGQHPLFVGTPVNAKVTRQRIEITGLDAPELLRRVRSSPVDFWQGASPIDAFLHYTKGWVSRIADDFADGSVDLTQWDVSGVSEADGYATVTGYLTGDVTTGPSMTEANTRSWRFETEVEISWIDSDTFDVFIGVGDRNLGLAADTDYKHAFLLRKAIAGNTAVMASWRTSGGVTTARNVKGTSAVPSGTYRWKIDLIRHHRWVYLFVNGELMKIEPVTVDSMTQMTVGVYSPDGKTVKVHNARWRTLEPLLARNATSLERHLPGAPTQGPLFGAFYDGRDERNRDTTHWPHRVMHPLQEPSEEGRRLTGGFANVTIATPQQMPTNEWYADRWVGSVYLDLVNYDYTFQVNFDDGHAVWIGKTDWGAWLLRNWTSAVTTAATSGSVRDHLYGAGHAASVRQAGWFPIIVEHCQGSGGSVSWLRYARSDSPATYVDLTPETASGTFSTPTASRVKTSPYGTFEAHVRNESHREMLTTLTDTFGFQWTCEPRSLESGSFPGEIVPKARIGRDTDYRLHEDNALDYEASSEAADVANEVVADASGIAHPSQVQQLTASSVDYATIRSHPVDHTIYESLPDITEEALLIQRLNSFVALRSSRWEQVAARPANSGREHRDSFPLTGTLALFDWAPGDGVRLDFPSIGVVDTTPRQITHVARDVSPNGRGLPTVGFRARPVGLKQLIGRLQRVAFGGQRNYQGQLTLIQGSIGSKPDIVPADQYSRMGIPPMYRVKQLWFVVTYKTDASSWTVNVQGTAAYAITQVGRYDVTPFLKQASNGGPLIDAYLSGGTGNVEYQLEALVEI
jgi:hypothetical protein